MKRLNYHHLYYFWRVAVTGNLTQVAEALHVSQSALSAQIKQLEHTMDVQLFSRSGRKLVLTDTGRRTLAFAEEIFSTGEELETFLLKGADRRVQHLSIGVQTNLSRNFVEGFVSPLLKNPDVRFSLKARGMSSLLEGLSSHEFDLVLTNRAVTAEAQEAPWQNQLVARQPVAIVGPTGRRPERPFPEGYENAEWVLPDKNTEIRSAFESLCAIHQYRPRIKAEADDMAMLRLLARDSDGFAVLPPVVVKDEINQGRLEEYQLLPQVFENFYAISIRKSFFPEALSELLQRNRMP
ncbi:transcriptional regulator, LysR family [Marinobacter daqiaonensis]|uniref:Transcriptional regulator, LysR family n=1 Tax=Marinobacter daqiaonensis TaxID=650891 RepID=A0A1I6I5C3_9GAMM|nr:LysR family transcriptional regulator [Marinobacter daqiaonensis]SFR61834.1 transcriptional regulator, LysR family [Marinobacter daqiaonensis]